MTDAPDPGQARLATLVSLANVVLIGPFTALMAHYLVEGRPTAPMLGLFALVLTSCVLAWWLAALRRRLLTAAERRGAAHDYLRTTELAGLARPAAVGALLVALLPTVWGLSRLLPVLIAGLA